MPRREKSRWKCFVFAEQTEQNVLGCDLRRAVLQRLVTGEKDDAPRSFCVAFEHKNERGLRVCETSITKKPPRNPSQKCPKLPSLPLYSCKQRRNPEIFLIGKRRRGIDFCWLNTRFRILNGNLAKKRCTFFTDSPDYFSGRRKLDAGGNYSDNTAR